LRPRERFLEQIFLASGAGDFLARKLGRKPRK
jgi:hypothetical protein